MKLNSKYFPILLFATLALGIILGGILNFPGQIQKKKKNNSKNKLNKLLDFIDNEYVDKVNADTITNRAINTILAQLDPHSVYIPPSEQIQVAENMKGEFVGIGVNFYMYKDSLAIIKPLKTVHLKKLVFSRETEFCMPIKQNYLVENYLPTACSLN